MQQQTKPEARLLDPRKFRDPDTTADGQPRAAVALSRLETLWFNTGTLCNLTCEHCYIESSPKNDRLAYLSAAEVAAYLDEVSRDRWGARQIGFTGGEPFMNPAFMAMVEDALGRGFEVLVLTNAMRPMMKRAAELLRLRERFGARLTLRVSIDHYGQALHEIERGPRSWQPALDGLCWLARHGFALNVAGRTLWGEAEDSLRAGYARLFAAHDIPVDARDPVELVLFPEMDAGLDVPEITESCWGILGVSPEAVMCATSRMVVKRKGAETPTVLACTLLPYDEEFELGASLADSAREVKLNHPHCARFCVLGGGSCSIGG
ncbi:MAG: radical SAM protein [Kiloniellales bacterium]